jgi:hypothetical protein
MRKLIIIAALATVAATGVAGCADNSVKPSSSSSAATTTTAAAPTTAADQTKQVCDEALSASTTAGAAIQTKFTELTAAAGDQAKQLQIGTDMVKIANDWSAKLTELSAKPINPQVKQALTEGVATISSLSNPVTLQSTTAAQAETQLKALAAKITTACAGA